MKAMILAAGRGTRLQPFTASLPKPMLPILGRPVMQSIVEQLARNGVSEIVVNLSYLAPAVQNYFGDGARFGVHMAYSFEGRLTPQGFVDEPLGSAGGVKRVQDFSGMFDDTFVVVCGDALFDLDLADVLAFHRARGALATIACQHVAPEKLSKYGVVATADDGSILGFQEKPKAGEALSDCVSTGIYVFEPAVLDRIPSGTPYDIGGTLIPALVAEGAPVYAYDRPFGWIDIGTVDDYWHAVQSILRGEYAAFPMPGREIAPGVRVGPNVRINLDRVRIEGPVYIAGGTEIMDDVVIRGPSAIGQNCRIETGAVLERCVVGDYQRIGSWATLRDRVVEGTRCVEPDGHYIDTSALDLGWLVDDVRRPPAQADRVVLDDLSALRIREELRMRAEVRT